MANKAKKPVFHVTLTSVGNPDSSGGYGRMENENAAKLLESVMFIAAENMVGEKYATGLIYVVMLDILHELLEQDVDIAKDVKEFDKKRLDNWTLKPEKAKETMKL
jgi:hypothetical protein